MKKNILITTTGEVRPIIGRLNLEKAAVLLESFNGLSETAANLDPIRGDLGALFGERDALYPIEGYEYGANTYFLMPKISLVPNPKAQEILKTEYNVEDTLPSGNFIIATLQQSAKDLVYFIDRQDAYRRRTYPSLKEVMELLRKELLLNPFQYFKYLEQNPDLELPFHPDFFYNKSLKK